MGHSSLQFKLFYLERWGREADPSIPFSQEVKNQWNYATPPPCLHCGQIKNLPRILSLKVLLTVSNYVTQHDGIWSSGGIAPLILNLIFKRRSQVSVLPRTLPACPMPQIWDMGQTALLPFRRKACWRFFRPKHPTASAGFEPVNSGNRGQQANHYTTEAATQMC
jgi:hypothetical protein